MVEVIEQSNVYLDEFATVAESSGPSLLPLRQAAIERFEALGFPTLRQEAWRFTNVAPIARTPFRLATPDGAVTDRRDLGEDLYPGADWIQLVFVNGSFQPRLSILEGLDSRVTAGSLASVLAAGDPDPHLARHAAADEDAFGALNTAFMSDGAEIRIPRGLDPGRPIHLLYVSIPGAEPTVTHPRNLVVAEPGSRATIVESYVGRGDGTYLTNGVSEIVAAEEAVIDHYKLGFEGLSAYHIGATHLHLGAGSTVTSQTVTIGGALVRNNITAVLDGPGAHCTLNGLYLPVGRQHVDNHLRVEHAKPHCDSREFFKGILDDHARAVFTGRIIVHKDAQKTDAKQTNMNLLLSEHAQVDTKPQLEILADDVKCTHGATIGQIDEEAIFYLRSRGIDRDAAQGVLLHAFANECLQRVKVEPLRRRLQGVLFDRLPQGELLREAL